MIVPAAEFQRNIGTYQDRALTEPVFVTRNGREKTVLLSVEEYRRLKGGTATRWRSSSSAMPSWRPSPWPSARNRYSDPSFMRNRIRWTLSQLWDRTEFGTSCPE